MFRVHILRIHGVRGVSRRWWPIQPGAILRSAGRLEDATDDDGFHALRIDVYLHQQGLDTATPAGKAMFQMMGVFAEVERAMIQEWVRAGTPADPQARIGVVWR